MHDVIYLDNNATTRPADEVVAAMLPYLTDNYGNASSVHRFGQAARRAVDHARGQIARLLGCTDSEITFTGGATESINTALRGLLLGRAPRRRVITSNSEHSATREMCQRLMIDSVEVVEIGVDRGGILNLAQLKEALSPDVALVTLLWANNETGVITPVAEVAAMCAAVGVPLHLDATQAAGKVPIDVATHRCDALSIASHKIHGPKGVGAMYVRRGVRVAPLLVGGPQEKGRRGGTENVPGIVGFGAAAELAHDHLGDLHAVAMLRDLFEERVLAGISDTSINGDRHPARRLVNTANINFHRLSAEAILLMLSERGICASAGAACSSGSLEPSHVIKAMGVPPAIGQGAVRFSLSRYTTLAEIESVLAVLPGMVARLREVMPVGV